jgi:hypothetical protein
MEKFDSHQKTNGMKKKGRKICTRNWYGKLYLLVQESRGDCLEMTTTAFNFVQKLVYLLFSRCPMKMTVIFNLKKLKTMSTAIT